jgi:hypothetical protein
LLPKKSIPAVLCYLWGTDTRNISHAVDIWYGEKTKVSDMVKACSMKHGLGVRSAGLSLSNVQGQPLSSMRILAQFDIVMLRQHAVNNSVPIHAVPVQQSVKAMCCTGAVGIEECNGPQVCLQEEMAAEHLKAFCVDALRLPAHPYSMFDAEGRSIRSIHELLASRVPAGKLFVPVFIRREAVAVTHHLNASIVAINHTNKTLKNVTSIA